MNSRFAVALTALALVACAPSAPKKTEEAPPAAPSIAPPPADLAANYKDCTWGEVSGGGVTLRGYSCGDVKLEGDDALPGIVQVFKMPDGSPGRAPVIQVFAKAPEAPLESALEAVRKASPGAEKCVFVEADEGYRREGQLVSVLTPTGKAKARYDAYVQGKGPQVASPCGPLGPAEAGQVTFEVRQNAPGKVLAIFWPSDLAPWDYASLSVKP